MNKSSSVAKNNKPKPKSSTGKKVEKQSEKMVSAVAQALGGIRRPENLFHINPTYPTLIAKGGSGNNCYITVRAPSSDEEDTRIDCQVTYAPQANPANTGIFPNGEGDIDDPFTGMMLTKTGLAAGTYVIHAHAEYDDGGHADSPAPDLTVTVP